MLTVGSLFAGIGGLDLGLERAGMEVKWQVEIDPFCRKVLAKHWPDVKRYEDVREVGAHNLEDVDLICGGFPCQDISTMGSGEGIDGEQSGLWEEFGRIVRELRPRFVLVENVPALRSRGLGRVLGDLAEVGYDAEWDCLPAAAVGAPHLRDRLFLVAYASCEGRRQEPGGPRRTITSLQVMVKAIQQGKYRELWPTPTADRWSGLQSHGENAILGPLNPTWVEWLMGFPLGWTDLDLSETPSSLRSPNGSGDES